MCRPVPCPYSACKKKVPLTVLEHHVKGDHVAKVPHLKEGHKPMAVHIDCKPHLEEVCIHVLFLRLWCKYTCIALCSKQASLCLNQRGLYAAVTW